MLTDILVLINNNVKRQNHNFFIIQKKYFFFFQSDVTNEGYVSGRDMDINMIIRLLLLSTIPRTTKINNMVPTVKYS